MNREKPHVVILPEDDANRQIANGIMMNSNVKQRNLKILSPARGCKKTADQFEKDIIPEMSKYPDMNVIMMIDFDEKQGSVNNFSYAKSKIPDNLKNRVFVLGVFSEPEKLKKGNGSYETIGEKLAEDCYNNTHTLWQHQLLKHNHRELHRMSPIIKPIIFN